MLTGLFSALSVMPAIILRTGVIYVLVLLGLRLTGKREVGQMTPFDLVLLLLLSNSVQNAMTGPDTSLNGGVVAAATLLILNTLVARLTGKSRSARKFIEGEPRLLIHDGKVLTANLEAEHMSIDELNRALREHNVLQCSDVALAVLEVDGAVSVLRYDDVDSKTPNHGSHRRLRFLNRKQS